jgi:putative peptide zinc metalloprotease protein
MLPNDGNIRTGASAQRRLASGTPLEATFRNDEALPTKSHPRLAMVLVPSQGADDAAATPGEPWVFPFDQPLPPSEGDNQAAAYNTTDDSATYDVAFALVWATGDEVLNVNEAHAYASCSNCVTVAVAFQVVLIMNDAHVVVPQNLSVAANYQCYRCITAAIASQLVLSVESTPGQEQLLALGEVWNRLTAFGRSITEYSLSEISTRLRQFEAEIVAILDDAPPVTTASTATPTPSPTDTRADGSTAPSPTGTGSTSPADGVPAEPASTTPTEPPSTTGTDEVTSTEPTSAATTETPTPTPSTDPTSNTPTASLEPSP